MSNPALFTQLSSMAQSDGIEQLVVGALIQHEGSVLLLQRPNEDFMGGIFELPSGKVEPHDGPDDPLGAALVREVKEETGLEVTDIREYLGYFDYISGSGKKSRQFNFAVSVACHEPIELTEHVSYLWSSITAHLPTTDSVKEIIESYRRLRAL